MQKMFVAAAALAMAVISMPSHAEVQRWQLIARVQRNSGFEPPPFLQDGAKVKVVYHVDVDASSNGSSFPALPRIRFDKDGSATNGGYILAVGGLTALNTSIKKPREDGVDFVSYNCFDPKQAATVPEALSICASLVGLSSTEVRFDLAEGSVWALPVSFQLMTQP